MGYLPFCGCFYFAGSEQTLSNCTLDLCLPVCTRPNILLINLRADPQQNHQHNVISDFIVEVCSVFISHIILSWSEIHYPRVQSKYKLQHYKLFDVSSTCTRTAKEPKTRRQNCTCQIPMIWTFIIWHSILDCEYAHRREQIWDRITRVLVPLTARYGKHCWKPIF